MPVVVVAGLSSGVGKTRLIEDLLDVLPGTSVLKVTLHDDEPEPRLVTSPEQIRTPGKDTARYAEAGAEDVAWLVSRPDTLGAGLRRAFRYFDTGLLLIESNSVIDEIDPDLILFVEGFAQRDATGRGSPKETADRVRVQADFITQEPFHNLDLIVERILEVMAMSEEKARELIAARAKDDRLPCAAIFKIAEEAGVPKKRMGELMNEMNLKIVGCQLGCFP